MLHDIREVLPSVNENWEELSATEKQQQIHMNNFCCGLHYLVGIAESTDQSLIKVWEFSLVARHYVTTT